MGRLITGTSTRGDWFEALADAIEKAKLSFPSDFVGWRLHGVSGENGGFVGTNNVSVTIDAATHGAVMEPKRITAGDAFPWPWAAVTTAAAQLLRTSGDGDAEVPNVNLKHCREVAQRVAGHDVIPDARSFSLYLIRAISEVSGPDGTSREGVPFPPEFIFVIDVGYPAHIGISVPWSPVLMGDATFPDFRRARCLSIKALTRRHLLFPNVASEILIGVSSSVSPEEAKRALEGAGLSDVRVSGPIATARCRAFHEEGVCDSLPVSLPDVVRYAQPNRVVRLVDIPWTVVRVM